MVKEEKPQPVRRLPCAQRREQILTTATEAFARSDKALPRWAAQLAPVVAIEAIIAWLDAGRPDRGRADARVRQAVMGVIGAAALSDVDCSLPNPASTEGPAQ